ncbi:TlpA family protein disulfide reductase [Mucilaginibacter litoreus]|uniref:TlpA family protein disulfide reductase n=1 Tax=Mucilaginibacter litoreus TaxID=1048221 RepID=A0ABW3AWK2_9SPHI
MKLKEMKKITFLLLLIIAGFSCTRAQNIPPVIAPYKILTTNDVYVTPADLPKNTPVMLIYFAPDCPHCQKLIRDLKPSMNKLKNIQVVMITFTDIRMVKTFENDYGLKPYKNFTLGTEGYTYKVQRYYQLKHTPYIAIYDHSGKLVEAFDKEPSVDDILGAVKKA